MKKVVSIALFGEGSKYGQYLSSFVCAHLNIFPIGEGWKLRVHYDDKIMSSKKGDFLRALNWDGLIEIDYRGTAPLCRAMLWRLAPIFDETVSHVFSRDLDAIPMPRDRAVCEQFIVSQTAMGTCHDSEQHVGIMGGLCHFKSSAFRAATGFESLDDVYRFADIQFPNMSERWVKHGADQDVLNRIVLVRPSITLLEHRYSGWKNGPGTTDREAGVYTCEAYSTPTPNEGYPVFDESPEDVEIVKQADLLGAHLGCAGYDHEAAIRFWDRYGDPSITERIRQCEKEAGI